MQKPKKSTTSFTLSDDVRQKLKELSQLENRSQTNALETLVLEAWKKYQIKDNQGN